MKINIYEKKIICSNPDSLHNYFAWGSVARLKDGRLAMAASGFRIMHVCPFGKVVMCTSSDEGKTWTRPTPVIDTPLDDRDAGIIPFGESSVLITSFNNDIATQKRYHADHPYINAYLDNMLTEELVQKYLGSVCAVSHDNGTTFSSPVKLPVSSPHGPFALEDGSFIYVGNKFGFSDPGWDPASKPIACYKIWADGKCELLGEIGNIPGMRWTCEPHATMLQNGTIIVHIRGEQRNPKAFTIFQCESHDGGRTFTEPHQLLGDTGGAPAHLLQLANGTLISAYGYREEPYGIRVMFSKDNGKTWDTDNILTADSPSADLGYPCTVELKDGKMLTVYYAHEEEDGPALIYGVTWSFTE